MTVLALTGGVGGAKLALGFAKILPPKDVVFVVNTGDDFEHMGLHISPDVDTLTYTLAEIANPVAGWGRKDETWRLMAALERLGGETWFRLGDADLALHLHRRTLLDQGLSLTATTHEIASRLGVEHTILPMSDDPVRTRVITPEGPLAFQHYFVRDRCEPRANAFEFEGAETARVNPAIPFESVTAIVICPSNPYVSVDPILAVKGMRDRLLATGAPIVAVSPIVGGQAIKGPTAKMMRELGVPTTTVAVAEHYTGTVSHFVIDEVDSCAELKVEGLGMETAVLQTVMATLDDRVQLARSVLEFVR